MVEKEEEKCAMDLPDSDRLNTSVVASAPEEYMWNDTGF
jgi:hypothetical protein